MILLQEQAVNNEEKSYKDNDQSCKKKRKLQTKNVSTHNISNLKKKIPRIILIWWYKALCHKAVTNVTIFACCEIAYLSSISYLLSLVNIILSLNSSFRQSSKKNKFSANFQVQGIGHGLYYNLEEIFWRRQKTGNFLH